jgi:hypothetical protein
MAVELESHTQASGRTDVGSWPDVLYQCNALTYVLYWRHVWPWIARTEAGTKFPGLGLEKLV